MMGVLELKITNSSYKGYFDSMIVYQEQGLKMRLSEFFLNTSHLADDFFKNANEMVIMYKSKPISLPKEMSINLKTYLTEQCSIYNSHKGFTCHQFAFLLKTGKFYQKFDFEVDVSIQSHQSSGDIVQFVKQIREFGSQPDVEWIHTAISLGNGLFLSKNGENYPAFFTLERLLKSYPCDYLTVVTKTSPGAERVTANSSIHQNFRKKTFVPKGLLYSALDITYASYQQLSRLPIKALCENVSMRFHPDTTKLSPNKAAAYFPLTQKLTEFLLNPLQISEYHTSLLAGNDWSIARILDLNFDSLDFLTVKESFEIFIALLKHYGNLAEDEELKIKNDPRYKQALFQSNHSTSKNNKMVIHITNDIARLANQDPHYSTSVSCAGKTHYLGDNFHFELNREACIADMIIHTGTAVCIYLDRDVLDKEGVQSGLFQEKIPSGLINYSDLKKALQLLEAWYSRCNNLKTSLSITYSKKRHLTQHQNNLVCFINDQLDLLNVGVYLGGNFYLILDPVSYDAYIVNIAWLQLDNSVIQVLSLFDKKLLSPELIAGASELFFTEAESFPKLSPALEESFTRYLLDFPTSKEYQLSAYIHGFKLKKTNPLRFNVDQTNPPPILHTGQAVLFCKDRRVITDALYLGNYLFLIESPTGHLCIANLLMLSEMIDWDSLFVMQTIIALGGGSYSCQVIKYKEKITFGKIQQPLLYEILGISFDLINLSMINEHVVIEHYQKRIQNEVNPDVLKVINCAYKLLMNDYYRVFYGSEIIFGGESELSVYTLLNFNDSTLPDEIVKGYTACLKLINNEALQARISNEAEFKIAKRKTAIAVFQQFWSKPVQRTVFDEALFQEPAPKLN